MGKNVSFTISRNHNDQNYPSRRSNVPSRVVRLSGCYQYASSRRAVRRNVCRCVINDFHRLIKIFRRFLNYLIGLLLSATLRSLTYISLIESHLRECQYQCRETEQSGCWVKKPGWKTPDVAIHRICQGVELFIIWLYIFNGRLHKFTDNLHI